MLDRKTSLKTIPRDKFFDSSLALLRRGYEFIGERCRRYGSDIFSTRIMLHKVTCVTGEDAARMFYAQDRFTRVGAMPTITAKLLQDFGSVQMLDGARFRHRKAMFRAFVTPQAIGRLEAILRREWRSRLAEWEARDRIVLFDEMCALLTRAVCAWSGIELSDGEAKRRTRELSAMIEGAGNVGPTAWWGLLLRVRNERWAQDMIRRVREGELSCPKDAAARVVAEHREPDGTLLPTKIAAVELINVLRPTVAVARFIVFGAMMMNERPELLKRMCEGDKAYGDAFAQEVRRLCPFFPFIGGRVREDFVWRGKQFAKGEWVLLDLYGTNRDPRSHREAERFDPKRFLSGEVCPFAFMPQGGGDPWTGHRCPGDDISVALTRAGVDMLAREMRYEVPAQDLRINLASIPALPKSRFVMRNVRRVQPARANTAAPVRESASSN